LLALSSSFLRGSSDYDTGSWEFWAGYAGLAGLIFGTIGLFVVWAVALISPPAANRAFNVRVYGPALSTWVFLTYCGIW
jgi:hypothetical protein